jgi:hypothetical protein
MSQDNKDNVMYLQNYYAQTKLAQNGVNMALHHQLFNMCKLCSLTAFRTIKIFEIVESYPTLQHGLCYILDKGHIAVIIFTCFVFKLTRKICLNCKFLKVLDL